MAWLRAAMLLLAGYMTHWTQNKLRANPRVPPHSSLLGEGVSFFMPTPEWPSTHFSVAASSSISGHWPLHPSYLYSTLHGRVRLSFYFVTLSVLWLCILASSGHIFVVISHAQQSHWFPCSPLHIRWRQTASTTSTIMPAIRAGDPSQHTPPRAWFMTTLLQEQECHADRRVFV